MGAGRETLPCELCYQVNTRVGRLQNHRSCSVIERQPRRCRSREKLVTFEQAHRHGSARLRPVHGAHGARSLTKKKISISHLGEK